jgi:hypothetical protein
VAAIQGEDQTPIGNVKAPLDAASGWLDRRLRLARPSNSSFLPRRACSLTNDSSITERRAESRSVPILWAVTRAPAHSRNTPSARRSGSARLALRQRRISCSWSSVLYSRMTRRAGWSESGSSTAALTSESTVALGRAHLEVVDMVQAGEKLAFWIALVGGGDRISGNVEFPREFTETGGNRHVLRSEVTIERHLVGAGRLRDRVDADGMDACDAAPAQNVPARRSSCRAARSAVRQRPCCTLAAPARSDRSEYGTATRSWMRALLNQNRGWI